jgi:hypothetical protein
VTHAAVLAVAAALVAWPGRAFADIDPRCRGLEKPSDYDEQAQQDFLANTPALALTYSPIHGPVPHEPGHGALGVDLAVIPPLSCERRYVLEWTKTEDTNRTPVAPKLRATFAFPEVAGVTAYAGVAYLPPVTVAETRTVLLSGELGFGGRWIGTLPSLQLGARFHATSVKVVADIARAFDEENDPARDDLYLASSFGVDVLAGWEIAWATPYLAVGFTDVSTFFYIGDDGVVANNLHPYAGLTFSVGVDALLGSRFRWGAEFYGAPGGYSLPDPTAATPKRAPQYGHLYTGRLRLGVEL